MTTETNFIAKMRAGHALYLAGASIATVMSVLEVRNLLAGGQGAEVALIATLVTCPIAVALTIAATTRHRQLKKFGMFEKATPFGVAGPLDPAEASKNMAPKRHFDQEG